MKTTIESLLNAIYEEVPEDVSISDAFEDKTSKLLSRIKETSDGYFEINTSELTTLGLEDSIKEKVVKRISVYQKDIESGQIERDPFELYVSYR